METGKRAWTKGIFISVVALLVGALALNGWALNTKDDKNKLLVTVEGVDITRSDVDHKIDTLLGSQAAGLPPEQLAQIRSNLDKRVLQNMIIEALLTKAVKDQQITIADSEVTKVLNDLKTSLPQDTDFDAYIKSIGFSEKDLVQTISRDLKIKKLLEAQVAGLNAPTDAEIQKFYDENSEQFNTPEGRISLAEAKPSIVNYLLSMQKEKLLNDYVDSLKSKAKIVYHDEALAMVKPAAG